ncbi:acriflavin resistance protein [Thioalkalivibrio sulfidiphilus HL-EbGr7]|uniref:Acriflavin resistance protein n=1 Tax=Thioalkalivibrio sulfidiphilus (strain HL-EbGR7) TaxID=396588 RepID=B8GRZ0_THISH|nr:efflux RND transporter permease subunit [Thioalkalivibrio sulfidiphilus]ACL72694.1 acriflavin resistance protein [Thioalkalivibrio sulfidiphilus HL-EbGr7]
MRFTDVFIKKPVLATVVSLFILLLGIRAGFDLNVRQFPEIKNAVVTVTTAYIGADADLIQGFITTPIEREIAAAEGIDYIVSTSVAGVSLVQANLRLDYDPNEALTQIAAQVNKVRSDLPLEAEEPVIELSVGQTIAAMYMSFYSELLSNNQITDYLVRVVQPQLSTIPGVQRAQILGDRTFAMRIWLDPERMAALNVTGADVAAALRANNVLSAVGRTKGEMVSIDLKASTDLSSAEEFEQLVVRAEEGAIVRIVDIAEVELGSENYDVSVSFNGQSATFIGIEVAPDANALDVIAEVRRVWAEQIEPQFPQGLSGDIVYDSTLYIQSAIDEVLLTIFLALVIVVGVIYLFLGSVRSVIIPALAVPLSLVGTLFLMLLMGFSINLLTLLAMVLAIGIVVDDAIIMVENIHRHIEEGMAPLEAAMRGARELAWPIVAMSTTLVAVFLPIGFVGGITGTLFIEFAFTLAASVIISGIVALTLSPMLSSRLLKAHGEGSKGRLEAWLDARFDGLRRRYQRRLHGALDDKHVVLSFGLIVLVSCYFLFITSPSELEPAEDQGFVFSIAEADAPTTLDHLERNTAVMNRYLDEIPEMRNIFIVNGFGGAGVGATNTAIAGFVLAPWDQRERSTQQVLEQDLQPRIEQIPGLNIFALVPPSLPGGGGGPPVEFVIRSTEPAENLQAVAQEVVGRAMQSGRFIFIDGDLKIDKPRTEIHIDRDRAALMGVDMQSLSADLSALFSGGPAGRFSLDNRSYRVIPQLERVQRLNPEQIEDLYTRNREGELVPLATLITLEDTVQPQQLKRFQQLNSVTLSGVPRPGVTLGEALDLLDGIAAEVLPPGYSVDYAGQSRQFKSEGAQLILTFFFALVVIYLVLAAQFESFRDSLIMMMTVPMSIAGALIFVSLGFATLNIYTQVGLVTLIGLIAKHGILIVEFANKLREEGLSKREAVEEAAAIRLRPILMTTAATVLAMIPLLIAAGPGAGARFAMGLVIASGMTIGTLFTLFVVPAMYVYLSRDRAVQTAADEAVRV